LDQDQIAAAERILRSSGLYTEEQLAAKRRIDERLGSVGVSPTVRPPMRLSPNFGTVTRPTRETLYGRVAKNINPASERGAASALLLEKEELPPKVVPDITRDIGDATFEPSDLSQAQAVTSLATTASGGTEIKFNLPGILMIGSGAIGVYWSRALAIKWAPLLPGRRFAYHPQSGFLVGTNSVGGINPAGVLTIEFYKLPPNYGKKKNAWSVWHKQIGDWTEGSGSDNTAGAILHQLTTGGNNGTDVTLGTFSDAGGGTQIFKALTNMPVGGAVTGGAVILNTPPANTAPIWVAETSALAVASNGGISAAGQDEWSIPTGGKLFILSSAATQTVGARFRS
jgi:hypothetical protein